MRRIYDSSGSVGQVTIRSMKNAAIMIRGTSRDRTVANTLASSVNIPRKDSPPFGGGQWGGGDDSARDLLPPEVHRARRGSSGQDRGRTSGDGHGGRRRSSSQNGGQTSSDGHGGQRRPSGQNGGQTSSDGQGDQRWPSGQDGGQTSSQSNQ